MCRGGIYMFREMAVLVLVSFLIIAVPVMAQDDDMLSEGGEIVNSFRVEEAGVEFIQADRNWVKFSEETTLAVTQSETAVMYAECNATNGRLEYGEFQFALFETEQANYEVTLPGEHCVLLDVMQAEYTVADDMSLVVYPDSAWISFDKQRISQIHHGHDLDLWRFWISRIDEYDDGPVAVESKPQASQTVTYSAQALGIEYDGCKPISTDTVSDQTLDESGTYRILLPYVDRSPVFEDAILVMSGVEFQGSGVYALFEWNKVECAILDWQLTAFRQGETYNLEIVTESPMQQPNSVSSATDVVASGVDQTAPGDQSGQVNTTGNTVSNVATEDITISYGGSLTVTGSHEQVCQCVRDDCLLGVVDAGETVGVTVQKSAPGNIECVYRVAVYDGSDYLGEISVAVGDGYTCKAVNGGKCAVFGIYPGSPESDQREIQQIAGKTTLGN